MYKLVAIDMDGTLLNEEKKISKANRVAIQKAAKAGVKIVLATGRPLKGIRRYLDELQLTSEKDYVVAYGGAVVQNVKTERQIMKNTMDLSDWEYLFGLSKELGVNIHMLTDAGCVTPKKNKYSDLEADLNGIPLMIGNPLEMDMLNADGKSIGTDKLQPIKIMLIDEPELLEQAIDRLPDEVYEKYTVVRSAPFFLEFLNLDANKGAGVEALAKKLDIRQSEVICIGDAGNDMHMVQYAGLGVAMENAFPELKQVADYITLSNEDDGVAHVIEKFILSKIA